MAIMRQTKTTGDTSLEKKRMTRAIKTYTANQILESEARVWIEAITAMQIGHDFGLGLRDGIILCSLINRIEPKMIRCIEINSKLGFKMVENILNFLNACRSIGVSEAELFETVDLFEMKNIGIVVRSIHALGRAVQRKYPNFAGPKLGGNEAIRSGRTPPVIKLMKAKWVPSKADMGKIPRLNPTISNHITFAADAVRKFNRPPPPPPPLSAERLRIVFGDLMQIHDEGTSTNIKKYRWKEDPVSAAMDSIYLCFEFTQMVQHAQSHSPQCQEHRNIETELEDTISLPEEIVWSLLDDAIYSDSEHKLYRHYAPNETLPRYYLRGNLPFPADTVFDTLFDSAYSERWKPMGIKGTKNLAIIDLQPLDKILHVTCELPWPFIPRDYVYQRYLRYYKHLDKDMYVMVSRAVFDGRAPESEGTKRVEIYSSRILIREAENGSCDIFMEYQDDTHFSIPGYIFKVAIALILPVFFRELKTACEELDEYKCQLETHNGAEMPSVSLRKVTRNSENQNSSDGQTMAEMDRSNFNVDDENESRCDRSLLMKEAADTGRVLKAAPNTSKLGMTAEFTVEFYKEETGLRISVETGTGDVIVDKYDRHLKEYASMSFLKLREGSRLMTVNGMRISGLPYNDVLVCLKNSSRPMKLSFQNVGLSKTQFQSNARIIKHPKARLRCVVPPDNNFKFIASLKPFRSRNGLTGAILQESISLQTRSTIFRTAPKYITVASGFVLQKVDGCNVLSVSYADIRLLLMQDKDIPKNVTLYATDAVEELQDLERASFLSSWSSSISQAMPRYSSSSNSSSWSLRSRKSGDLEHEGPIQQSSDEDPDDQVVSYKECLLDYSDIVISEDNVDWAWKHIQALRVDERLISVKILLDKLEMFFSQMDKRQASLQICKNVQTAMEQDTIALTQILKRYAIVQEALHEFNYEKEAEWQFAQSYLGVSTFWKPGENGTIWLKMDGLIEGADILNTLAVIREIDLYRLWAPFCTISEVLKEESRVDLLAYLCVSLPILTRDAVLHAFGVNACYEHRCILLLGQSASDDMIQVPKMKGWNVDRIDIRGFRAKIEPIELSKAQACIVVNMDIKCSIPKSLLNYGIRKGAGLIHHLISRQAVKIEKACRENIFDEHVKRIHTDPSNVYSWLRPRLRHWFEYKEKGCLASPLPLDSSYKKASPATSKQPNSSQSVANDPSPCTQAIGDEAKQVPELLTVSMSPHKRMLTWSTWGTLSVLSLLYLLLSLDLNHPLWITCASKFLFLCSFAQAGFQLIPRQKSTPKTALPSIPPSYNVWVERVMYAIAYDVLSTCLARAWVHRDQAGWTWVFSGDGHRRSENIFLVTSCIAFIGVTFVLDVKGVDERSG
ncbi:hypothetical protein ABG067_000868 [Albugo candida]